jgi:hypothetical protein
LLALAPERLCEDSPALAGAHAAIAVRIDLSHDIEIAGTAEVLWTVLAVADVGRIECAAAAAGSGSV